MTGAIFTSPAEGKREGGGVEHTTNGMVQLILAEMIREAERSASSPAELNALQRMNELLEGLFPGFVFDLRELLDCGVTPEWLADAMERSIPNILGAGLRAGGVRYVEHGFRVAINELRRAKPSKSPDT